MLHVLRVLQAETARRREVEQQLKLTKMQLVGPAAAAAAARRATCILQIAELVLIYL